MKVLIIYQLFNKNETYQNNTINEVKLEVNEIGYI